MRTAAEQTGLTVIDAEVRNPDRLEASLIVPKAGAAAVPGEPESETLALILQTKES